MIFKPFALFVGLRYLTSRRGRLVTFLLRVSLVGLCLGVALLILVLSVMNGFYYELRERILGLVPHVIVYHADTPGETIKTIEKLNQLPQVRGSAPFTQIGAMLSHRGNTEAITVHFVSPEQETQLSLLDSYMTEGSMAELVGAGEKILLGKALAEKLQAKVGDTLAVIVPDAGSVVSQRPQVGYLRVAGLFATHTELDQSLAVTHHNLAKRLISNSALAQAIRVTVTDPFDWQAVQDISDTLGTDYDVRSWFATHGDLYLAIDLSKRLVALMLFAVIAVAAFNLVSSLVMVVDDQRMAVAVMSVLGASGAQIMATFALTGFLVGAIGTGLGILLGIVMSLSVPTLVSQLEALLGFSFLSTDIYPIDYLPVDIYLGDIVLVSGVALLACLFAAVWPAIRIAKTKPANVLRFG